jgi:hypothetical protein
MAFVGVAVGVGTAVGLGTGTAALIGGGALIGAGIGGLYSGITGDGDILNSMLTGALLGGGGAFGLKALGVGAAGTAAGSLAPTATAAGALPSTAAVPTANVLTGTAAQSAGYGLKTAATAAPGFSPALGASANLGALAAPTGAATTFAPVVTGPLINPVTAGTTAAQMSGTKMLGYGLAGTSAMQLLGSGKGAQAPASATYPGDIRPFEYSARPVSETGDSVYPTTQYDMAGNPILDSSERTYFDQNFKKLQPYKAGTANPNPVMAAQGGLMAAYPMEKYGNTIPSTEVDGIGMAKGGQVKRMFGGGMSALLPSLAAQNPQMFSPQYEYDAANQKYNNVTPQGSAPSGLVGLFSSLGLDKAQGVPRYTYNPQEQSYTPMAAGGQTSSLGSYSDGGRMLKGPGDGMSDNIPGVIGGKQPARLADGEFVVPADVVSHLGNGSTDAGAKRLYAMMDTVRKARTGTKKQGKQIKADKYLPA